MSGRSQDLRNWRWVFYNSVNPYLRLLETMRFGGKGGHMYPCTNSNAMAKFSSKPAEDDNYLLCDIQQSSVL